MLLLQEAKSYLSGVLQMSRSRRRVVWIVDTSGSIYPTTIKKILREIRYIRSVTRRFEHYVIGWNMQPSTPLMYVKRWPWPIPRMSEPWGGTDFSSLIVDGTHVGVLGANILFIVTDETDADTPPFVPGLVIHVQQGGNV